MNHKHLKPVSRKDLLFILGISVFFFSCIATTYHAARTLNPGQGSFSAGYMQARSFEEFTGDPVQLTGLNARVGALRGLDFGLEHTWDITKDSENTAATFWGDVKVQLTNRDYKYRRPIISTGLLKGYAYKEDAKTHFTSLPVMLGFPMSERFIPTLLYRYELLSEDFFPNGESFDYPRHTFALGFEYDLIRYDPSKWTPKIGFSVGTLNSLAGDPEEDNVFIFNFGVKINSPLNPKGSKN
jgi:hypothetical protein